MFISTSNPISPGVIQMSLSRCESKEAPCCLSTVGFIPALTRTGQAPFRASGGPTPADEASFSHAYSPFVVAAYCCPSGFGMPGMSRPLPLWQPCSASLNGRDAVEYDGSAAPCVALVTCPPLLCQEATPGADVAR